MKIACKSGNLFREAVTSECFILVSARIVETALVRLKSDDHVHTKDEGAACTDTSGGTVNLYSSQFQ